MSKKRTLIVGLGCLGFVAAMIVCLIALVAIANPGVPRRVVLSLHLDSPIVEVAAEDPFAQLTGETSISMRDLHAAVAAAAEDERVQGLRLRIDSYQGGFATARELRALIESFSASGKWTAAYMDTAGEGAPGNISYYLASACDEISLNPMGDVNLIGISARSPFIRGSLDKLGIRPEFRARGDYKTARFMYTESEFTPAHREMMEWLLDSLMTEVVDGVAVGRGLDAAAVREIVDKAPYLGSEALEAGLVDQLEDWTGFRQRLADREENEAEIISVASYLERAGNSMGGPKIAVVTAIGGILRGESRKDITPLLGGEVMGSDTIARAWRDVRADDRIKAAIFRIDSGGGSAIASEVIRQEMARTAEQIPVVVSMSNAAASGGYWIACGAHKIVADSTTITGSIGVYGGHFNADEFWREKLGVTFGRIDRGANADIYGDLEDWNEDQRSIIERQMDRIYDAFLDRVSEARGMSREEVDAIGRGRVFTGAQAIANGLVDRVGGFDVALAEAKELAGIDPDKKVQLIDYPKVEPWWQRMLAPPADEEAAVAAAVAELEQWWRTGRVQTPGAVWMPPIYVE